MTQTPFAPQPMPSQQPRAGWPMPVGIISIVLAGLGLMCTPISLAQTWAGPGRSQVMQYFPPWYFSYAVISSFVGIGQCVLLLVGGIFLLSRRPAAAILHLLYAVLGLLGALLGVFLMLSLVIPYVEAAGAPAVVQTTMTLSLAVGLTVGMAYPIFLLVWFSRPKIRQQIRQWREARLERQPG